MRRREKKILGIYSNKKSSDRHFSFMQIYLNCYLLFSRPKHKNRLSLEMSELFFRSTVHNWRDSLSYRSFFVRIRMPKVIDVDERSKSDFNNFTLETHKSLAVYINHESGWYGHEQECFQMTLLKVLKVFGRLFFCSRATRFEWPYFANNRDAIWRSMDKDKIEKDSRMCIIGTQHINNYLILTLIFSFFPSYSFIFSCSESNFPVFC